MKKLTAAETKMLEKLQAEYNKIHERMDYATSERCIAACNKELDKIVAKMDAIINR